MKLHEKLFFLLVLLLPTQLARHFWPDFSLVFGIRVDYLSPSVYLTDILVLLILASWLPSYLGKRLKKRPDRQAGVFAVGLAYLLLTSSFIAQNQGAAVFKFFKIVEFFFLGLYVYKNWGLGRREFRLSLPLSLAVVYSSLIAWAQFLFQGTIGGPLWWLGERTFNAQTPGIALTTLFGQEFLRPYSIFPHPNALAGFLLVSAILLIGGGRRSFWQKAAIVLATLTILISFSHSAWFVGIVVFFLVVFSKKRSFGFLRARRLGLIKSAFLLILLTGFVQPLLPSTPGLPQEFVFRQELAKAAGRMIGQNPIFGVGLNNFLTHLPEFSDLPQVSWWLQPVHNIFLLAGAEVGLIGLAAFIWLWYLALKRASPVILLALLAILITGSFDHYWLTLQQNQLLLTIVLSLAIKRS